MVGGVEELSIEQLASSISTYKEQLEQVRSRRFLSSLCFRILYVD